jgi:cobalt/nickel transport system permease protein
MSERPLPEWLTKEENYIPGKDKDAFVNKSILSMLGIISRIQQQGAVKAKKYHAQAVSKLTFTLLLVVFVSLSRSTVFLYMIIAALLCRICLMQGAEIVKILRNGLAAALFTAAVLLPAGLLGNWYSLATITPKVFVSVSALSLLSYSTRWVDLTGALKSFFVPDIFIFVLDIAIKYILLLGEVSLNMLYALKLRSVGKNSSKHSSLSGIAGTLFLRSREMAEEMHSAMECRGFSGEYHRTQKIVFGSLDACLLVIGAGMIFLFIYLRK